MKAPSTEQDWKHISDDFEKLWNLPHVLGAIGGKHFGVDCPKRSGSKYHNYKDFYECFESYDLFTYANVRFSLI